MRALLALALSFPALAAAEPRHRPYHKTHDTFGGEHTDVAYTEVWVRGPGHELLIDFERYAELEPTP